MTNTKQASRSADQKPAATPAETLPEVKAAVVVEQPVAGDVAKVAAPARARRPRKPSAVAETVAKHQKALAEALEQAEAICYDPPQAPKAKPAKSVKAAKAAKVDKPAKVEKPVKAKKPKLVRDSYAMPEAEYAQIAVLKKRMGGLGSEVKKSELLRAGVAVLAALNDAELKAVMDRVERIKTGRPSKK